MQVLNLMWSAEPAYHSVHLVMANVEQSLQPCNFEHHFLIGEAYQQSLIQPGSSFNTTKRKMKRWWSRTALQWRLRKFLQTKVYDAIILDGVGVARIALPLLSRFSNSRVLIYFHGQTQFKKRDLKLLAQIKPERLRLIAVSETLALQIRQQVPRAPVLAVPTYLYLPISQPVQKQGVGLRLGAVGRLTDSKNFSLLIEVMQLLRQTGFKATLNIAGEGELRDQLDFQVAENKLEQWVYILGRQENIAHFYQQLDVLLVPSLKEGQGLVIQEALHYGAAVICSDLPVFQEQLKESGYYLPVDSAQAWATAISELSEISIADMLKQQRQSYGTYSNQEIFHKLLCDAIFNELES